MLKLTDCPICVPNLITFLKAVLRAANRKKADIFLIASGIFTHLETRLLNSSKNALLLKIHTYIKIDT